MPRAGRLWLSELGFGYRDAQASSTVVAIERTILTAVWNMLTHHTTYAELGGDYYTRRDPMRAKHKAIRQLEALGYQVIVQPAVP